MGGIVKFLKYFLSISLIIIQEQLNKFSVRRNVCVCGIIVTLNNSKKSEVAEGVAYGKSRCKISC